MIIVDNGEIGDDGCNVVPFEARDFTEASRLLRVKEETATLKAGNDHLRSTFTFYCSPVSFWIPNGPAPIDISVTSSLTLATIASGIHQLPHFTLRKAIDVWIGCNAVMCSLLSCTAASIYKNESQFEQLQTHCLAF
ncbi:hypothetical protein AVEN_155925-1 [Araneus ventricosus]|uniref:Uncharacterized protein n=1 Tax=Araneus ventricosus TaxID=182803 RepID=A0A4Y2M1C2_ARAVE|nr:hypothetical protein AVEN_155925-1 [Araneus ventricosus]